MGLIDPIKHVMGTGTLNLLLIKNFLPVRVFENSSLLGNYPVTPQIFIDEGRI